MFIPQLLDFGLVGDNEVGHRAVPSPFGVSRRSPSLIGGGRQPRPPTQAPQLGCAAHPGVLSGAWRDVERPWPVTPASVCCSRFGRRLSDSDETAPTVAQVQLHSGHAGRTTRKDHHD